MGLFRKKAKAAADAGKEVASAASAGAKTVADGAASAASTAGKTAGKVKKGLFGGKKKTPPAADSSGAPAPKVKRKGKSFLSGELSESVWDTVSGFFEENDAFKVTTEDGDFYVGLVLDTGTIPDFSKKSKNESYGAFIQSVATGKIHSYLTPEELANEHLLVIPDMDSLSRFSGYGFLARADLIPALVSKTGEITLLEDKRTNYHDCNRVFRGETDVYELLGFARASEAKPTGFGDTRQMDEARERRTEDTPDLRSNDEEPDEVDPIDNSSGDDPEDEEPVVTNPTDTGSYIGDEEESDSSVMKDIDPSVSSYEPDDTDEEDDPLSDVDDDDEPDVHISGRQMDEELNKRYFSNDLDVAVDMNAFDTLFETGVEYRPLVERLDGTWLGNYTLEMAKKHNDEISILHNRHITELRNKYHEAVVSVVNNITDDMDIHRTNTKYGQLVHDCETRRSDRLKAVEDSIEGKLKTLQDKYEKRREDVCKQASLKAGTDFDTMYSAKHESDLKKLEDELRAGIEAEYRNDMKEIFRLRKDEAARRLDSGVSVVLKRLRDIYDQMFLPIEQKAVNDHMEEIDKYLKDNHDEELTYIRSIEKLEEDKTKAHALTIEMERHRDEYQAELDRKEKEAAAEFEKLKNDYEARLEETDKKWADKVAAVESNYEAIKAELDKASDRSADLLNVQKSNYEARIEGMQLDIDNWKNSYASLEQRTEKSGKSNIFLVVAASIATLAVGIIVGALVMRGMLG